MKKMIVKIMLVLLVIGSLPMHADLKTTLQSGAQSSLRFMQNGARSTLQSVAQNPGWTSLVAGCAILNMIMIVRYQHKKNALDKILKNDLRRARFNNETDSDKKDAMVKQTSTDKNIEFKLAAQACLGITVCTGLFALAGSYVSKFSGWLGSKI